MKSTERVENVSFKYLETSQKVNAHKIDMWIRLLFLYLGVCGSVTCILSALSLDDNILFYYLILIPICIGINYLFLPQMTILNHLRLPFLIALFVTGVICFQILSGSFLGVLKQMNLISSNTKTDSPIFFILYSSLFITYLLTFLLNKRLKIYAILFALACVISPYFFGYVPSLFPLVLVFMFVIGVNILYDEDNQNEHSFGKVAVAIVLLIYVLYVLLHFSYLEIYFKHKQPMSVLSNQMISIWNRSVDDIQNEEITAVGGMNKGELGQIDKIDYKNITMLTLQSGFRGNFYLRGYVGSAYHNNRWNDLSEEQQDQAKDMMENFQEQKFDVYNLQSQLFRIIEKDKNLIAAYADGKDYEDSVFCRSFRVTYQNASKDLWYLPYNNNLMMLNATLTDYPISNESGIVTSTNYHINTIDYDKINTLIEQYQGNNQELQQFRVQELEYRDFVYQNYTEIDQEAADAITKVTNSLPKHSEPLSTSDKIERVKEIRAMFQNNYQYTLSPGRLPDGKDFVTYFLNESKQGYCTYFATAATLLLRNMGIPARYVEGYKVNVNQNNSMETRIMNMLRKSEVLNHYDRYKEYTVNILDRDAHAWVEIYADGVGWIPVDVTPVMSSVQYAGTDDTDSSVNSIADNQQVTDYDENVYGDTLFADIEPEQKDVVIVRRDNPETIELYREQMLNKYHCLMQYLVDNKYDALENVIIVKLFARDMLWLFFLLLKIIAVLLILSIIVYIPTKIREVKRYKLLQFHPGRSYQEYQKQLLEIYHYLERMGRYYKVVRKDTMPYTQWADELNQCQLCFSENQITEIVNAILQSRFSDKQLSEDSIKRVIEQVRKIQSDSYQSSKRFVKLKYRFIYNLR